MAISFKNGEGIHFKTEDFKRIFQLDKNFKLLRKIVDPRFGEVSIFFNKNLKQLSQ